MEHHAAQTSVDADASPAIPKRHARTLPFVSIIVVNYATKGLLFYCLRRLLSYPLPYTAEVIVVDNASADGSARMVAENFPSVRCLRLPVNRGFAAGTNHGLLHARGRYFLVMNPDIVIRAGGIEGLIRFLDQHPTVGIVGPRLLNPDNTPQQSCYRFPHIAIPLFRRTPFGHLALARRMMRAYCMEDADHTVAHPTDWILGACMLVRAEAIDRVGLMDERFFLYFEDIDWCRRFWKNGYEVWYAPQATLTHFHQRLSAEATGIATLFSRLTRVHIESGMKYFWKWGIDRKS